jgi:glyoxylase-like metal-dependent hydrolase (beta-lactamase superfamily II)
VSTVFCKGFPVGPFAANCYLLGCETSKRLAVIDPGGNAGRILGAVGEAGFTVEYIFNTHGHLDHVGANGAVKQATGAPILIAAPDAPMLTSPGRQLAGLLLPGSGGPPADRLLADGDTVALGELLLRVLLTPGHTPGSACFLVGDDLLFTGDTLFAGSVGRTDLSGGCWEDLLASIRDKLLPLGDGVRVLPGHGEATTIGQERRGNPFLQD